MNLSEVLMVYSWVSQTVVCEPQGCSCTLQGEWKIKNVMAVLYNKVH